MKPATRIDSLFGRLRGIEIRLHDVKAADDDFTGFAVGQQLAIGIHDRDFHVWYRAS